MLISIKRYPLVHSTIHSVHTNIFVKVSISKDSIDAIVNICLQVYINKTGALANNVDIGTVPIAAEYSRHYRRTLGDHTKYV